MLNLTVSIASFAHVTNFSKVVSDQNLRIVNVGQVTIMG
jgi:hypothetical protein